MKTKKLVLAGMIVCLCGVAVAVGDTSKTVDLSSVSWVTENPPAAEDLTSSVRVIEFWATWCAPCKKQIPHINSLAKKYEDRNVIFIGLSVDRSIDEVRKFVKKKVMSYNVGMDGGVSDSLDVSGIPKAFIISHEGKVVWSGNPADAEFEEALKTAADAAPKAMLTGVELGQFSHLRIKLCGGRHFAKAYAELEGHALNGDSPQKTSASRVLEAVNARLREKITAAQNLRETDPHTAVRMYKFIMDNYAGISLTAEIEPAYRQLQQQVALRTSAVVSMKTN